MTGPRVLVAVLGCCLTLAVSTPSAAAADPASSKAAFEEGRKLVLAGDYRAALASFKKGFLSTEDPAFMLNIAQCHRFLGEPKEAVMMYRLYLKSTPEGANREARAVATRAIHELESEAAAAPPAMAPKESGAPAPPPSVAAPAPMGSVLEPPPPSDPSSGTGFVPSRSAYPILDAPPGLDIKKVPTAPPTSPEHREATARRLRLAGIACGAAGLVSVAAGVYYWTRASSLSDSANKAKVYNQGDYDEGQRAETMQWIFYGVGAAAVATGAILYVYGRWLLPTQNKSVSLAPMVGPGATGLQAQGTF